VDEASFCSLSVKPNFASLKARAASKLKEIGQGLSAYGFAEVARLEAGETLPLAGEQIALADVLLVRKPAAGQAVVSDADVTLVLDTSLTPELVLEGISRELVSVLQQARKSLGLEVSDRVRVAWESDHPEVVQAVEQHAAVVRDEILALELVRDATADRTETLNGRPVRFRLEKA
jgi:isoleucyl-tRNA synthetase